MILCLALVTLCEGFAIAPSYAVNWEGHDDWFNEHVLMQEFVDGVPKPIVKPMPDCDVVRRRHAQNVYEQVAIVGVNCLERE